MGHEIGDGANEKVMARIYFKWLILCRSVLVGDGSVGSKISKRLQYLSVKEYVHKFSNN